MQKSLQFRGRSMFQPFGNRRTPSLNRHTFSILDGMREQMIFAAKLQKNSDTSKCLLYFSYFCLPHRLGAGRMCNTKNSKIMINDLLESTAVRRARRNKDIKMFFEYLTITRHISFMDAYEVIGYHFYLSAEQIRQIIAGRCQKW